MHDPPCNGAGSPGQVPLLPFDADAQRRLPHVVPQLALRYVGIVETLAARAEVHDRPGVGADGRGAGAFAKTVTFSKSPST